MSGQPEIISRAEAKARGLTWYFNGKPCKNGHIAEQRVRGGCRVCRSDRAKSEAMRDYSRQYREENGDDLREKRRIRYKESDTAEKREKRRAQYIAEDAERRSAYQREYREANASRLAEYRRRYAEENAEKLRDMGRLRYMLGDPEKRSAYQREYRADNLDLLREYDRQRYTARAEYVRLKARLHTEANPDGYKARQLAWRLANPEKVRANTRNQDARRRNAEGCHTKEDILAMYATQRGRCKVCDASFDTVKYHVDHIIALASGGSNWPSNLQLLCAPCNLSKGAKDFNDWWLERLLGTQIEGTK